MKEARKLLEEVKAGNRPTAEEGRKVAGAAKEFVAKLEKALKASKLKAKPVVGGSGAKGTWLKGMHDIDVFVCFDYGKYKEKSGELSELLSTAVKRAFPRHERLHGSRDYFKASYGGYNFEIVPILKITKASQAKNITDASLLHAAWVTKEAGKRRGLDDEIRATKAFCKAQRVYGAESHIKGLSGYACEVLTIYYGGFLKLIATAATKWPKQVSAGRKIIIDAARHYKGKDPLRELNEAKVQSELIVIDPIQKDRNATAALGGEAMQKFIAAAEAFLKKPSKSYFEKQEITHEKLLQKAKGRRLIVVEATPVAGKEDVAGAKVAKAFEHVLGQLEEKGFNVIDAGWEWRGRAVNSIMWFITGREEAEPELRHGPPLSNKEHAERFRQEHSGKPGRKLFEKNGRLYAIIEREYRQPYQLMRGLIEHDDYLKDKARVYRVKNFE